MVPSQFLWGLLQANATLAKDIQSALAAAQKDELIDASIKPEQILYVSAHLKQDPLRTIQDIASVTAIQNTNSLAAHPQVKRLLAMVGDTTGKTVLQILQASPFGASKLWQLAQNNPARLSDLLIDPMQFALAVKTLQRRAVNPAQTPTNYATQSGVNQADNTFNPVVTAIQKKLLKEFGEFIPKECQDLTFRLMVYSSREEFEQQLYAYAEYAEKEMIKEYNLGPNSDDARAVHDIYRDWARGLIEQYDVAARNDQKIFGLQVTLSPAASLLEPAILLAIKDGVHRSFKAVCAHELLHHYSNKKTVELLNNASKVRGNGIDYEEGLTEYFAQQLYPGEKTPLIPRTYPSEVTAAKALIEAVGIATVKKAYFGGDEGALEVLIRYIMDSK